MSLNQSKEDTEWMLGEKVFLQPRTAKHWIKLEDCEVSSQEILKHRLNG